MFPHRKGIVFAAFWREWNTVTANPILLQKKYSRVIECFAKRQGLSLDAALDFFYHSQIYQLIRDGVSDMHCMSDAYLAEELEQEYAGKVPVNVVVKDMI